MVPNKAMLAQQDAISRIASRALNAGDKQQTRSYLLAYVRWFGPPLICATLAKDDVNSALMLQLSFGVDRNGTFPAANVNGE